METFEEKGIEGERDHIPCKLMNTDGGNRLFSTLKPFTILVFNGFVHYKDQKERRKRVLGLGIIRV